MLSFEIFLFVYNIIYTELHLILTGLPNAFSNVFGHIEFITVHIIFAELYVVSVRSSLFNELVNENWENG